MIPAWAYDRCSDDRIDLALGDLFAYGCLTFPEKLAISDHRSGYSFRELNELAELYALYLHEVHGILPQDRVMVLARKTCEMPAIAIALWKLGAVYMPIDAKLPIARLLTIMERAKPALVIMLGSSPNLPAPIADLSKLTLTDASVDTKKINSYRHQPQDIAYIIHTSGSTGTPKGVQITERSLKRYFHAHNAMLRFHDSACVFSLTPFHFDVSIEDTLLPLSLGSYVYQFNSLASGDIMRRTLIRERITHLIAVSTLLTIISDKPELITRTTFPEIELVMTGAEVCAPSVINLWKSRLPEARVYNVYGPTEATIVCTGYEITKPELERTKPYPIGKPLEGVTALLLDSNGVEISEPDLPGELCIGGDQVMAGYLDQPEETSRRIFLRSDIRFYRTGDLCTRDHNGDYHFVGRNDSEVKLNGRRINLNEVQVECLSVSGIERAAIGLIQRNGVCMIGAVVVTNQDGILDQVRSHLMTCLPNYMQPVFWGIVQTHQLSSTGKTDDRSLLALLEAEVDRNTSSVVFINKE